MVTRTLESNDKTMMAGIIFLAAMLLLSGNARVVWSDVKGLSRTDSQGPVTVTAAYVPPDKATDEIRFTVRLNTHSVNLDRYRLEDFAFIRFDGGAEHKSIGTTRQGSGHHVTETLRFAGPFPKGAGEMFLIIRNLGGVTERTLKWKLPFE